MRTVNDQWPDQWPVAAQNRNVAANAYDFGQRQAARVLSHEYRHPCRGLVSVFVRLKDTSKVNKLVVTTHPL